MNRIALASDIARPRACLPFPLRFPLWQGKTAFLLCLLLIFGQTAPRAFAGDESGLAPVAVITVKPFSTGEEVKNNAVLANLFSQKLCAALKGQDLPVISFPIPVG